MDVTTIIPAIWKLMRKRKLTINITNIDNELSVSIIKKIKLRALLIQITQNF